MEFKLAAEHTRNEIILRKSKQPLLFIDGSYYIFYRYYAIFSWYKLRRMGETIDVETLLQQQEFVDKYQKMFVKHIVDLMKKHGVTEWSDVVFFQDAPRCEVWRNEIYCEYKGDREVDKRTFNGDIFPYTYKNIITTELVGKKGMQTMMVQRMEADDLIAVTKKLLRQQAGFDEKKLVIVTNDNDYIQLYDEYTIIENLKGQSLKDRINVPIEHYLKLKIIGGDKSDCIPPIAAKVGPKTAAKLASSAQALEEFFGKHPEAREQYEKNKALIDMACIPDEFVYTVKELLVFKD